MRRSNRNLLCALALGASAGFVFAQEQGPLNTNPGTVAKKKPADGKGDDADLPKIPSAYTKKDGPDLVNAPKFKTEATIVTLDAAVMDNKGQFIPGIPPAAFRVLEDNVPQKIAKVDLGQAPMTVALVIEFSGKFQQLYGPTWWQTLQLSWGFASSLQKEDYLAVIAYDIKPEILCDFTTDRSKVQEALGRLTIPAWQEANLFDALVDTADRMSGIEGRKAILVLTSGIDTFSQDHVRQDAQVTAGIGRADLRHQSHAVPADHCRRADGSHPAHGFSAGGQRAAYVLQGNRWTRVLPAL